MTAEKLTVLIADDDTDIIEQMQSVIKKKYNVESACSGSEAVEKAVKIKPACIVLDVMMTHMSDGLDTARELRANPVTAKIPVIMLTSVNKHYDYRSQMDADFFPYSKWLDKPVKPEKLLEEIDKLVK